MTSTYVFLIIVGLVIIVLSYMISETFLHKSGAKQKSKSEAENNLSDEHRHSIQKKIQELCDLESERVVDQTKEKLSKISNEKIMSMNEFSEQILEKIEQNHSEVVFLYNMLNDKEESIKKQTIPSKELAKETSIFENNSKEPKTQMSIEPIIVDKPIDYGKELNKEDIMEQELAKVKVLQLYSEGKSVIEIARLLEIGQGEIKLMIEMARGNKNEA